MTQLALTQQASTQPQISGREAGEVHRTDGGLEAFIAVTSGRGFSTSTDLVKLSGVFPNEIDALVAIAVGFDAKERRGS